MPTRQTLRDFLTSIGSTNNSISLPIDPGSDLVIGDGDDLGIEPGTGKELLSFDTGESLLGDYTAHITQRNEYPISPGVHEAVPSIRGSSIPDAETSSASRVFAGSRDSENVESLNRSNSLVFDSVGYPLGDLIDKTGDGSAASGNDLLPDVVSAESNSDAAPDQSQAVVASFAFLRKYNQFSPTSDPPGFAIDASENTITESDYDASRNLRFQTGEGVYEPNVVEVSAEIDQTDLSKIARSMLLKAAGWDTSTNPADATDPNRAFDDVTVATLGRFPEIVKRNQSEVEPYRAQDSFGMPINPDGSSFLDGRGDAIQRSIADSSYMRTRGSMYTPDQPFGQDPYASSDKQIQALQAAISMLALGALIEKKIVNYESYYSEMQIKNDEVLRGPYLPGSSIKSIVTTKSRALIRSFMFQTGIYSYAACVSEGLYACLGFESFSRSQSSGNSLSPQVVPADINSEAISSTYLAQVVKISKNLNKGYFESYMGLSHGFWRAISESAIRTASSLQSAATQMDGSDYARCLLGMKDALVFKIMNIFAAIGYQHLVIQSGKSNAQIDSGDTNFKNPYDMNSYPSTAGTRQMKSRDGDLLSRSSLAWRNSALPSAFILPVEAMATALDMDYMFDQSKGSNPIKGMLGSTLYDKTYVKAIRNSNTIPSITSRLLEDRLGAEYLPFYFRDLRTNEIVAFHGFVESLSDGFTANFAETRGFGRADAVQNYTNTSRDIQVTFWIVSTSREDFDEMWFKINKLTTLLYPQYTRGRPVSQKDQSTLVGSALGQTVNFEQPFSQLAGGSPIIRLRVGDLIKTNYTRSNFARLFGVGNDTFGAVSPDVAGSTVAAKAANVANAAGKALASLQDVGNFDLRLLPFLAYAASPMELAQFSAMISTGQWLGAGRAAFDVATELASYLLKNGFVNPLLASDREKFFRNNVAEPNRDFTDLKVGNFFETIGISSRVMLKARATPYAITDSENPTYIRLRRPVFAKIDSARTGNTGTVYTVTLDDVTIGSDLNGSKFEVSAADLFVDSGQIVDIGSFPGVLLSVGLITGLPGVVANAVSNALSSEVSRNTNFDAPIDTPLADLVGTLSRTFTSPYNNPITRAFEDRMGEGLAGVVKSMSFTWMESPWESDWNSRAPTSCKITMRFVPIHDISPGLDSNGFNRAPIYNVGQIMNDSFGHSRSDGGNASKYFYKKTGATAENAQSQDEYNLKL